MNGLLDKRFHQAPLTCLSWHPEGGVTVTGDEAGMVCVTHPKNGKVIGSFQVGEGHLEAAALSGYFYSCPFTPLPKYPLLSNVAPFSSHPFSVAPCFSHPSFFLSPFRSFSVFLSILCLSLSLSDQVFAIVSDIRAYTSLLPRSPTLVAAGTLEGKLYIWDLDSSRQLKCFDCNGGLIQLQWHGLKTKRILVVGALDGTVQASTPTVKKAYNCIFLHRFSSKLFSTATDLTIAPVNHAQVHLQTPNPHVCPPSAAHAC